MATRRYGEKQSFRVWAIPGVIVLVVFAVFNASSYYFNEKALKRVSLDVEMRQKQLESEARLAGLTFKLMNREEKEAVFRETRLINRIIFKDVFPWTNLLDQLEENIPESVVLDKFELTDDFDRLKLTGHSDTMADISLLLTKFENWTLFHKNILTTLSVESENNGKLPAVIRFSIEARLNLETLFNPEDYGDFGRIAPTLTG